MSVCADMTHPAVTLVFSELEHDRISTEVTDEIGSAWNEVYVAISAGRISRRSLTGYLRCFSICLNLALSHVSTPACCSCTSKFYFSGGLSQQLGRQYATASNHAPRLVVQSATRYGCPSRETEFPLLLPDFPPFAMPVTSCKYPATLVGGAPLHWPLPQRLLCFLLLC